MKVRNPSGRQILIPDQRFVAPGPDFVTVKDTDEVQDLVAAGVLEVESTKVKTPDPDTADKAKETP